MGGKVASKIRVRNRPDIRRWLTESGIRQKITIRPSLLCTLAVQALSFGLTSVC